MEESRAERSVPASAPDEGEVAALTSAIAAGDSEAFGVFYEAWFDRAYTIARSLTRRDESFCLDVVQDAMLRVVRRLRPMPDAASLERWMVRVVHSTAIDRLRSEARRLRREERAMNRRLANPVPQGGLLELEERVAWLSARLEEVSAEERTLLAERFERERTLNGAGAAVGISGDAAHGKIRRVLERLRKMAREAFGE